MKALGFQYTPIGFRTRLYDLDKSEVEPDSLLQESLAIFGSGTYNVNAWDYRRKAINRVLDRVRDFGIWLRDQETNSKLTPSMRALIEDTITYINTGVRPMNLAMRMEMIRIEKSESPVPRFKPTRHTRTLISQLSVPAGDYMYHWLSHKDGFHDMLCTMNIIFGDVNQNVIALKKH